MNPTAQLNVEKPAYGGDFIARIEGSGSDAGKAVFVPLTLPGETLTARILEHKRTSAKAEPEQILAPSPHRVAPPCPYFASCGGCQYQHADYPAQLAIKQQILRETLTRAGVAFPPDVAVLSGDPWAYRNRIRLAVTPNGEIGYRSRRSHDIIPIQECPIAAPILVEIALDLDSIIDTKDPRNDLSEVELFVNHDNSELLISFHTHSGNSIPRKLRFIPRESSSRPLAEIDDQTFLTYRVAGHAYQVPHGAFFQVNRHLLDPFVDLVLSGVTGNSAWDLFAGVGLFARQLAARFSQVHAVESAPASAPALHQNLAGTAAQAVASTTLDFLRRNRELREPRPDLIVLDPPRAGLGEATTTLLNAIGAPQIVYVSCDPTTLARDLRALTAERYAVESITLVDMFPQTFHIETVARLRRS
jgi:23S rRNA (uracil1939-C5)-methyltransferase